MRIFDFKLKNGQVLVSKRNNNGKTHIILRVNAQKYSSLPKDKAVGYLEKDVLLTIALDEYLMSCEELHENIQKCIKLAA